MDPQGEVTSLLVAWGKGDQNALNELMPLVLQRAASHGASRLERAGSRQYSAAYSV